MKDFSSAILILVFAFTGFEMAMINTGEMSNPAKDIPFALIFSTLFVAIFYIPLNYYQNGDILTRILAPVVNAPLAKISLFIDVVIPFSPP